MRRLALAFRAPAVAGALVAVIIAGCSSSITPAGSGVSSTQPSAGRSSVPPTAIPVGSGSSSGQPLAEPTSIPAVGIPVTAPTALAADGSTMWMIAGGDVARFDVATSTVQTLGVGNGDALESLAATRSAIWVADFDASQVLKIDPATGTVVDRIRTGTAEDVMPVQGTIWVTNHHEGSITRIDGRTDKIIGTVIVGKSGDNGPHQLAEGAGSVWVDEQNTDTVIRLNPSTGAVVARISMPTNGYKPCGGIAATDAAVWVTGCFESPSVVRIDPATNAAVATVSLDGYANDPVVIDGAVWVPVGGDGYGLTGGDGYKRELERIDPATNLIDRKLPLPALKDARSATVADGDLWLANGSDSILRVPLSALSAP